jgi:hypothetical protein
MGLEKYGVKISCEGCQYVALDGEGGFEVSVPLSIGDEALAGMAKLRCTLGSDSHKVELVDWMTEAQLPAGALEEVRQRVAGALDFVAARRIGGSHHICPAEVIRVVSSQGGK